ncbi:hypothetical protein D3C80_2222480 [compost metagenome]
MASSSDTRWSGAGSRLRPTRLYSRQGSMPTDSASTRTQLNTAVCCMALVVVTMPDTLS